MIYPCIDNGGYRKFGFYLKGAGYHTGHDFNCPAGTYIRAIENGKVIFNSQSVSGYGGIGMDGGVVWVLHGDYVAQYGHVKSDLPIGATIREQDIIGIVSDYWVHGNNIPHLHFCIVKQKTIPDDRWGYVKSLKKYPWTDPIAFIQAGMI